MSLSRTKKDSNSASTKSDPLGKESIEQPPETTNNERPGLPPHNSPKLPINGGDKEQWHFKIFEKIETFGVKNSILEIGSEVYSCKLYNLGDDCYRLYTVFGK